MLVFLNGKLVPEEKAHVSVFDRGFLYGDGLFETLRVFNGKPFRWAQHFERLRRGAAFLNINIPFAGDALREFAHTLISRNQIPDSLLRLTLSRGVGVRGYSPKGADHPTLVMSLHPAPADERTLTLTRSRPTRAGARRAGEGSVRRWALIIASPRLPADEPLAQYKTCNKLPQILARAEADAAGADEALLLNTAGLVAEASTSNVFWIEGDTVCTPPLASGILAGVTRAIVFEICGALGVRTREICLTPEALRQSDGVFLTLSARGIVEAASLDGRALPSSVLIDKLRRAYCDLVRAETE